MQLIHYFDYKSPYAYLAQAETFALADEFGAELTVQPYSLDIPSFLGAAELDAAGNDTLDQRNAHQWRRVRYSYMDCRREANRRGLVIRGPRKIFDSVLAHIGFYYASEQGDFHPYHDIVFERFWRRELDIGDPAAIEGILKEAGYDAAGFADYAGNEGRRRHDRERAQAEEAGVFGVPSYRLDKELFWGAERLERVRELLMAQ